MQSREDKTYPATGHADEQPRCLSDGRYEEGDIGQPDPGAIADQDPVATDTGGSGS